MSRADAVSLQRCYNHVVQGQRLNHVVRGSLVVARYTRGGLSLVSIGLCGGVAPIGSLYKKCDCLARQAPLTAHNSGN